MDANTGAASAMSRWCSHSRPITHANNLFAALGLPYLMSFACGLERSRADLWQIIDNTSNDWSKRALQVLYCALWLVLSVFSLMLIVVLLLNEVCNFLEQFVYTVVYTCTLGIFNYSRLTSFYGTFMNVVATLVASPWHDSTTRLITKKRACGKLCKAGQCKAGKCYKLDNGFLFAALHISCECFKKHLNERMELSRERDACKTYFVQSNRITDCKYLWRPSALEQYFREGCGVFNDEVIERHYDMERSMFVSVRLETVESDVEKFAMVELERSDLDEVLTFPIDTPDRLFEMPELRYAFLKNRARRSGKDVVYTPVVLVKRATTLLLALLQIRFASKSYEDERALAISLLLTTVALYLLSFIRETVSSDDMGGSESPISRMLAIDSLSVGQNLIRYNNRDTTWTRYKGYGSVMVGNIDVLENILHNRSFVLGNKVISLSREGVDMYIADVVKGQTALLVKGWRKADRQDVVQATLQPAASIDTNIGSG